MDKARHRQLISGTADLTALLHLCLGDDPEQGLELWSNLEERVQVGRNQDAA
jgi:plasmid maintenance system antidote protein VapI